MCPPLFLFTEGEAKCTDVLLVGWPPALVIAAACSTATVAQAQSSMLPSDPGYTIAADMAAMPALQQSTNDTYLVSSNNAAALSQRVNALEAALSKMKDEKEDDGWEDTSKEKFSVKFGGRIMADAGWYADQNAASAAEYNNLQDYAEFRRIRIFAKGEGYGVYDYKFQLDWAPGLNEDSGTVELKDLYGGIHEIPYLGYVRVGHFKAPFSLEELTSSKYITFMERSLPNVFAPSRRAGVAAYNHTEDEKVTWAYGAFYYGDLATAHENVDDRQGIRLAARGTWAPIYTADGRGLLHFGAGVSFADLPTETVRFRTRPEIHETQDTNGSQYFLSTNTIDARDYITYDLEMAMVYGPFSLQSELMYTNVDGIAGQNDLDFYGAYVYASYFLTGENRVYKRTAGTFDRVKPFTNFFMVRTCDGAIQSGWGAWELAARYSFLDFTNDTNARAGLLNDFTMGVNWYWNPNMRMMFNYIHAWSDIPAQAATCETDIVAARWQVDF
jgi:phosphate-selective porin OprO/OprP